MVLIDGTVLMGYPLDIHVISAGWTYNDGNLHRAIDWRTKPDTTRPVYAMEDGTVKTVQYWDGKTKTGMQSYGNMVLLRHKNYTYGGKNLTLETRYAHLSRIIVKLGDTVKEGQIIGYAGMTGHVSGAHLHTEVLLGGSRSNPLSWLDADWTVANAEVGKHLGAYKSVVRPASGTADGLFHITATVSTGDYARLYALAQEMGLPENGYWTVRSDKE